MLERFSLTKKAFDVALINTSLKGPVPKEKGQFRVDPQPSFWHQDSQQHGGTDDISTQTSFQTQQLLIPDLAQLLDSDKMRCHTLMHIFPVFCCLHSFSFYQSMFNIHPQALLVYAHL